MAANNVGKKALFTILDLFNSSDSPQTVAWGKFIVESLKPYLNSKYSRVLTSDAWQNITHSQLGAIMNAIFKDESIDLYDSDLKRRLLNFKSEDLNQFFTPEIRHKIMTAFDEEQEVAQAKVKLSGKKEMGSLKGNNKILLSKFAQLFKSNTLLDISKTIICGETIISCLGIAPVNNLNYAGLNKLFDQIMSDAMITDDYFMQCLLKLDNEGISRISPEMWAEVYESEPFKRLDRKTLLTFQRKVNNAWPYISTFVDAPTVNAEDVVLQATFLRRMVNSARLQPALVTQSLAAIDKKVNEFTDELDSKFLSEGKFYGNDWSKKADLMTKMRLSDIKLFGEEKGNNLADAREATIHSAKTKQEKEAVTAFYLNAHDKTRLAALAAFNKSEDDYPDIFLANNVDGSDKKNKHLIPKLLGTFGMSTATSMGLGVAIPLLANVPVVGNFVGPMMAGGFTVGKTLIEVRKAMKIAKSDNRKLTTREKVNIGINAFTSVAPYAAMLALGPLGRGVGTLVMGSKTFAMELVHRKESLPIGQKLSGKDIMKSLGNATARSLAMYLGGALGGKLAQGALDLGNAAVAGITDKFFNQENTSDINADNQTVVTENVVSVQQASSQNEITADEASLRALREHKFDLTDHARQTANPDTNRMYQLNRGTGDYTQQDWYDKAGYDRAISVLKEAGVADADGALRNLAGANMFKGGEFRTELNNLLQGKLTTNTITQILKADNILDNTADLIGGVQQQTTSTPVNKDTTFDNPKLSSLNIKLPVKVEDLELPETSELIEKPETPDLKIELPDKVEDLELPETTEITKPEQFFEKLPEVEPVTKVEPLPEVEHLSEVEPMPEVEPEVDNFKFLLPDHDTGVAPSQFNSGELPRALGEEVDNILPEKIDPNDLLSIIEKGDIGANL